MMYGKVFGVVNLMRKSKKLKQFERGSSGLGLGFRIIFNFILILCW